MERKYYEVSEKTAKVANDINSFSSYCEGSATASVKNQVNEVYDIVEKIKEERPSYAERAERMADRYSWKLSQYYNDYFRNEASCPSVMICGASNFPVRKKEKQNSRRETLLNQWNYLEEYKSKIEGLLTGKMPILSGDENAIELLEDKLERLEAEQEKMKSVNAYYRKNKTLDGCEDLTEKEIERLKKEMSVQWHYEDKPYMSFHMTNNSATIRNTRARLESLKKTKEQGTKEVENEYFTVVENTEIMRLQLIFDSKPESNVREILKKNGFKWSNRYTAWQRQLTPNAKRSLVYVLEELKKIS